VLFSVLRVCYVVRLFDNLLTYLLTYLLTREHSTRARRVLENCHRCDVSLNCVNSFRCFTHQVFTSLDDGCLRGSRYAAGPVTLLKSAPGPVGRPLKSPNMVGYHAKLGMFQFDGVSTVKCPGGTVREAETNLLQHRWADTSRWRQTTLRTLFDLNVVCRRSPSDE